jgi:glycerol-3-phosphate O-acyltransferase
MHSVLEAIRAAGGLGHIILYVFKESTLDSRQMFRAYCNITSIPVPTWIIRKSHMHEAYDLTLKSSNVFSYPARDAIRRLSKILAVRRPLSSQHMLVCFVEESNDGTFNVTLGETLPLPPADQDGGMAVVNTHQAIVHDAMKNGFLDGTDWKAKYYEMQDTPSLMKEMLRSKSLKQVIAEYSATHGVAESKAIKIARKYMKDMMSRRRFPIVRACNSLIGYFLKRHFRNIQLSGFEQVKNLERTHSVIYVPTHRSHVDFLMFPHLLTRHGLLVTHNVSSNHLTPLPFGPVLRGVGGFFIYREAKDEVYRTILKDYMGAIMRSGLPIMVFIEGTRSRDGKPQKPKKGILSQLIENHFANPERPLAIVPVYIGYDKVGESESMLKDTFRVRSESSLSSDKEREAFQAKMNRNKTLRIRVKALLRRLRANAVGNAYVHLGRPLLVDEYLNPKRPGWEIEANGRAEPIPEVQLRDLSHRIAMESSLRIYEQTVVTPVSLFSLGLSSIQGHMMEDQRLINFASRVRDTLKYMPYHEGLKIPQSELMFELQQCKHLPFINRERRCRRDTPISKEKRSNQATGITYLTALDVVRASLPKNNIAHLTILPSIVAHIMTEIKFARSSELVARARGAFDSALAQFTIPLQTTSIALDRLIIMTADAMVSAHLMAKGPLQDEEVYSLKNSEDTENLMLLRSEARELFPNQGGVHSKQANTDFAS